MSTNTIKFKGRQPNNGEQIGGYFATDGSYGCFAQHLIVNCLEGVIK